MIRKGKGVPVMSDTELVERLSNRRAQALPVMALMFLWQQLIFLTNYTEEGTRGVDRFKAIAWVAVSVMLLLALLTNRFWFRNPAVWAQLDDEATRFHRAEALRVGFIAAMAACILLYFTAFFEPLTARATIHIIMTCGIGAALIRFAMLERRAAREEA